MNIQQLAAEKAREKYPTDKESIIQSFNECGYPPEESDITDAVIHRKNQQEVYTSAWQDCLNHLAGSEGDVEGCLESIDDVCSEYNAENYGLPKSSSQYTEKMALIIQKHTATHCAKVLSQQHQREIKWSYDGIKYRIHMFYGESEHHCDSDFFTIIGLEKMGIPECAPPINQ